MSVATLVRPRPAAPTSSVVLEAEQALLLVDRRGAVLRVTPTAATMLTGLGLGCDLSTAGPLRDLVDAVWQRFEDRRGRDLRPLRAELGSGVVARVTFRRSETGHMEALLAFAQSARCGALQRVAAQHGLTRREVEIVNEALTGAATKQIASRLCLSAYTVQDHFKSIFAKCQVASRLELAALVLGELDAPGTGRA